MRALVIAACLALLTSCATPQRLNLNAEEQAQCDAEGGCLVISRMLYDYLMLVHEMALQEQSRQRRGGESI